MAIGGKLSSGTASRLLFAAAAIDLTVVVAFWSQVLFYTQSWNGVDAGLVVLSIIAFPIILLIYWVVVEIFLSGLSPGRIALTLSLRDLYRQPLQSREIFGRALLKFATLGLSGLNWNRVAPYDRAVRAVWYSPIAATQRKALPDWRLIVADGKHKTQRLSFGAAKNYKTHQTILIGRDPDWADLALPKEGAVSSRHCTVQVKGSKAYIADHGSDGTGSSNGTIIHGRRLRPNEWVSIGNATHFRVGNVKIILDK